MSRERNVELAKIHIACQQLGMDEDSYRAMLMAIGRVQSSADLDVFGRARVLEHLVSLGWRPVPRGRSDHKIAATPANPQDKKIRALWLAMADAGIVKNREEAALLAYVKRVTGCDRLEWITSAQAGRVIESLKQWQERTRRSQQ